MFATVLHEAEDRVSVAFRAVDAMGREIHQIPSIRIPCHSYDHARATADAFNSTAYRNDGQAKRTLRDLLGPF